MSSRVYPPCGLSYSPLLSADCLRAPQLGGGSEARSVGDRAAAGSADAPGVEEEDPREFRTSADVLEAWTWALSAKPSDSRGGVEPFRLFGIPDMPVGRRRTGGGEEEGGGEG